MKLTLNRIDNLNCPEGKRDILVGTSKNIPLWCDDRRSSSQRGRSFNPWPSHRGCLKLPPASQVVA